MTAFGPAKELLGLGWRCPGAVEAGDGEDSRGSAEYNSERPRGFASRRWPCGRRLKRSRADGQGASGRQLWGKRLKSSRADGVASGRRLWDRRLKSSRADGLGSSGRWLRGRHLKSSQADGLGNASWAEAGRWEEIGVTCGRKPDGQSNILEARGSLEVEASRIHKLRFKSKEIDGKNGVPDFKTSDPSSASVK